MQGLLQCKVMANLRGYILADFDADFTQMTFGKPVGLLGVLPMVPPRPTGA